MMTKFCGPIENSVAISTHYQGTNEDQFVIGGDQVKRRTELIGMPGK